MQLDKLYEELEKIAFETKRCIQYMMESERGVNDKIRENTLVDSHIYDDLHVDVADINLIQVFIHDYYQYIESGMMPGNWVPEEPLLEWMADKGIDTDNDTLYRIQWSIWKWGISPRPFLDDAFDQLDDYWDDFANEIFDILLEDVTDWFEN